jgi:hypothetical protein
MTAEIAVMNKRAIALASDSAVTIGNGAKFYNTANKLFMLSKYEPVGIMIYSNAEFMGVPWEIIVKEYRSNRDSNSKYYLSDYANDFFNFIVSSNFGFENHERKYYESTVNSLLLEIKGAINTSYSELAENLQQKPTIEQLKDIISNVVDNYFHIISSKDTLTGIPDNLISRIKSKYNLALENCIDEVIGLALLDPSVLNKIKKVCNSIFIKDVFVDSFSGVVFAGFGKKDIFPRLVSYHVSGYIDGFIKKKIVDDVTIDDENDYRILPFAQTDTVETFLYGVNNKYLSTLNNEFSKQIIDEIDNLDDNIFKNNGKDILKQDLIKKWNDVFSGIISYSQQEYLFPILRAIRVLPIDELASMAESLVNLTSFKRQVAMDEYSQTVGGPIDVAVISKGDGFIWIKRKHYFKPELNHHYFDNYYKTYIGKDDKDEKN